MNWELLQVVFANGLLVFLLYYSLFVLRNSKMPQNKIVLIIMGIGYLEMIFEMLPHCITMYDLTFFRWMTETAFFKYAIAIAFMALSLYIRTSDKEKANRMLVVAGFINVFLYMGTAGGMCFCFSHSILSYSDNISEIIRPVCEAGAVFAMICSIYACRLKGQMKARGLYIVVLETIFYVLYNSSDGRFMSSLGTTIVLISVVYGYYDLVKLKKSDLFIFADKDAFEAKLTECYHQKKAFYLVSAYFENKPSTNDIAACDVIREYEEGIRDLSTFFLRETDSFLFSNEPNCITAILPKRKGDEMLTPLMEICNRLCESFAESHKYKVRICIADCPEEEEDLSLMTGYISLFGDDKTNRALPTNRVYRLDEVKGTYRRAISIEKVMDVLCGEEHFSMYYQPIFSETDGYCSSVEALIRFPKLTNADFKKFALRYGNKMAEIIKEQTIPDPNDPKSFIFETTPDEFLERAEEKGMIHKVGRVGLRKVCEFFKSQRLNEDYGVKHVGINLSLSQLEDIRLSKDYVTIINRIGMDPSFINFEISGNVENTSIESVNRNLEELTRLGVNFALEDFGTGFSNVINIVDEKYKVVKIDKALVDACYESENRKPAEVKKSKRILSAVIAMIKRQKKILILEGIGTDQKRADAKEVGIEYLQGFYFSEPLNKINYTRYMHEIGGVNGDHSKIEGAFYKNS